MYYTDSVTREFLQYGSNVVGGRLGRALDQAGLLQQGGRWQDYQDPTYLGFYFTINDTSDVSGGDNYDYFPMGLFLPDDDPDSAVSYLRSRGEYYRASMIQEFRQGMQTLVKKTPWIFTKVSGLSDIWKYNPANNYRGKDKKITIETTEGIDLKITYLLDLYRKAVFDAKWHRYILPENQRMFSITLYVTEIRTMQEPVYGPLGVDPLTGNRRKTVLRSGTFLSFKFDKCEIDLTTAPPFLDSIGKTPGGDPVINNFTITTPVISEKNTYGLLGGIVSDTYFSTQRGQAAANSNFFAPSDLSNRQVPTSILERIEAITGERFFPGDNNRQSQQRLFELQYLLQRNQSEAVLQDIVERNLGVQPGSLGDVSLSGPVVDLVQQAIGELTELDPTPSANLITGERKTVPLEAPPINANPPGRVSFTEDGPRLVKPNIGNNYNV